LWPVSPRRLVQVFPQVVHVLQPDRQPQQLLADADLIFSTWQGGPLLPYVTG
jgi:hypothetical protein